MMALQYDLEDQLFSDEYPIIDPLISPLFRPVAPVTLTRRWCPKDSAAKWLGEASWFHLESKRTLTQAVAAIWAAIDPEPIHDAVASSEDEAHFRFLLLLAAERAVECGDGILLVCCPGWSFENAVRNPMGVFGYSSLSAGRLYPERIPSGAFKATD